MPRARKVRLSNVRVARLAPRKLEYTVWDTVVSGLGVRVRPSGHRGYLFQHSTPGRSKKVTLGSVTLKGIEEARRECLEIAARAQRGETWSASGRSHSDPMLFSDFVSGQWKAGCYARYKPSTRKGVDSVLRTQLLPVFGSLPLHAITRDRVNRWFDTYSATAPGGANHALANLSQILNHAIACGHIESHSLRAVRRNPRTPLTRFLSQEEIGRLHRVLDEYRDARPALRQQADVIRLLLLTGCRKREITNLRWSEVSGDSLKLSDSKTGPRTVYLNAQARAVLERQPHGLSPFVFPSPRDPSRPTWAELPLWWSVRKKAGIDDVRLHDLRHSFASHAVLQGVPLPVVSRLLGHTRLQMTLRYAHVADREVEAAAERVGEAIAGLLTPA